MDEHDESRAVDFETEDYAVRYWPQQRWYYVVNRATGHKVGPEFSSQEKAERWALRCQEDFEVGRLIGALPRTHGGARPGAGRKPLGDEPMERRTVTLPAAAIATLEQLGQGNLSAGIRAAIAAQEERPMTTTAQYVKHATSGEHYYIETDDAGTVVTATGPLYFRDRTAQNLAERNFDSDVELVDDINADPDAYVPAEPWSDDE